MNPTLSPAELALRHACEALMGLAGHDPGEVLAAAELIAREAGATVTTRPWHGLNLTVAAGPHLYEALNAQIPE